MKVKTQISPQYQETFAIICSSTMNKEVVEAEALLSGLGQTHQIFSLFIQIGSCFLIYALFVLHYRQEARTLNAALQKKKHE